MSDPKIATVSVDVRNMPEVIAEILSLCATRLREEADSEADQRIARRLMEIAADFETGALKLTD
jgi:hypothetical protein